MAFSEMTDDLDIIAKYPDEPYEEEGYTSTAFKASFDMAGKLCKAAHNVLVRALNAVTAAANVGFSRTAGVPANNVQDAIVNVQGQVAGQALGQIPDASIGSQKMIPGGLLEDVTSNVHWAPADQDPTYFSSNDIHFYYCRALGIVLVKGAIKNLSVSRATDLYPNATINFNWNGYTPKNADACDALTAAARFGEDVTYHATIRFSTSGNMVNVSVRDTALTSDMLNSDLESELVDVYVSGWYFCDGE